MFQSGLQRKGEEVIGRKLSCIEKGKAKVEEEISEEVVQQQVDGYLLAYLKKVEDEVDEPETTIEELEEVSLDGSDPDKKVLVGTLCKPRKLQNPKIISLAINM